MSTPTSTDPTTAAAATVGLRSRPVEATGPQRSTSSTTRPPRNGPSTTAGTATNTASTAAIAPSCSAVAPRERSIEVSTEREVASTDADSPTPYRATPTNWMRIAAITAAVAPIAMSVAAISSGRSVTTSTLTATIRSPIARSIPAAPARSASRSSVPMLAGSGMTRHRKLAVPAMAAKSTGSMRNGPISVNDPLVARPSRKRG